MFDLDTLETCDRKLESLCTGTEQPVPAPKAVQMAPPSEQGCPHLRALRAAEKGVSA